MGQSSLLRDELVSVALKWQEKYGVSPAITSTISEFDAAILVGMSPDEYSEYMQDKTAVSRGADFIFKETKYQIKACRPSGKPGSKVTTAPKARNYDWDIIIWMLYDKEYRLLEAWQMKSDEYKYQFDAKKRLTPDDYRSGERLFMVNPE
jgi:hypothetical protein